MEGEMNKAGSGNDKNKIRAKAKTRERSKMSKTGNNEKKKIACEWRERNANVEGKIKRENVKNKNIHGGRD